MTSVMPPSMPETGRRIPVAPRADDASLAHAEEGDR
ncbi:hypothetical protein ABIA39_001696 [Nocardia sp. GAS34]